MNPPHVCMHCESRADAAAAAAAAATPSSLLFSKSFPPYSTGLFVVSKKGLKASLPHNNISPTCFGRLPTVRASSSNVCLIAQKVAAACKLASITSLVSFFLFHRPSCWAVILSPCYLALSGKADSVELQASQPVLTRSKRKGREISRVKYFEEKKTRFLSFVFFYPFLISRASLLCWWVQRHAEKPWRGGWVGKEGWSGYSYQRNKKIEVIYKDVP